MATQTDDDRSPKLDTELTGFLVRKYKKRISEACQELISDVSESGHRDLGIVPFVLIDTMGDFLEQIEKFIPPDEAQKIMPEYLEDLIDEVDHRLDELRIKYEGDVRTE